MEALDGFRGVLSSRVLKNGFAELLWRSPFGSIEFLLSLLWRVWLRQLAA
jgi:hypothetical protein